MSSSVLIVSAETSSATYAERLLKIWKDSKSNVQAFGIGSRSMEKLGFDIVGRSEEMAVVGLFEVLKHYGKIRSVFYDILKQAKERKPKVALLMDYPEFNLRLAKELKKMGIPVVYFISPQIWAWRTSRVYTIKKRVDHMLVVFPFEVPFYAKYGVPVTFVGHPLLDEISPKYSDEADRLFQRKRYGVGDGDMLLGLMPGSRNSELDHHLQTQIETAQLLKEQLPSLKLALLVAPNFEKEQIKDRLGPLNVPLILLKDEPFDMIRLTDAVLCASGTATLMVGLMKKPMIIMYKMNAMTAYLAKKLVKQTPFFGMVNLIMEKLVSPELFQEQANPQNIASHLQPLLDKNSQERQTQMTELAQLESRLGSSGAMERVSGVLLEYLRKENVKETHL